MEKITEELLQKIAWIDFSIQKDGDNNCILILVAQNEEGKNGLYNMMRHFKFKLLSQVAEDKTINIHLKFDLADLPLSQETGITEEDYVPLKWLMTGEVKYVTTGLWLVEGTLCDYYKPPLHLDSPIQLN